MVFLHRVLVLSLLSCLQGCVLKPIGHVDRDYNFGAYENIISCNNGDVSVRDFHVLYWRAFAEAALANPKSAADAQIIGWGPVGWAAIHRKQASQALYIFDSLANIEETKDMLYHGGVYIVADICMAEILETGTVRIVGKSYLREIMSDTLREHRERHNIIYVSRSRENNAYALGDK